MRDLVLRGASIVDGSGREPFVGDIAIDGDTIVEVGGSVGRGRREIDADGLLVTPGFIDIHTHYDGQATWDGTLAPSSKHGVTSILMGNCGVGFAPVRPGDQDFLIEVMEGVEDIPGTALHEGLRWDWETFPEYLDALDRVPRVIDVGTQVPHAALRVYVMGERGGDPGSVATTEEAATMARLTADALRAGALGFASSRNGNHRTRRGAQLGTLAASDAELVAIAEAVRDVGRGVLEFAINLILEENLVGDVDLIARLSRVSGRPASFGLAGINPDSPDQWRLTLDLAESARTQGYDVKAQVSGRVLGILYCLQGTFNPFTFTPTYRSIAQLPIAERLAEMRRPEIRARVLDEHANGLGAATGRADDDTLYLNPRSFPKTFDRMFALGDPPNYEPDPSTSIAARATRAGTTPEALLYDTMVATDGREVFWYASNYAGSLDDVQVLLAADSTIFGLSDGGAHVGFTCDASMPTFLLSHWCRDRTTGSRLDVPWVVNRLTAEPAAYLGLDDRGLVEPGRLADLNLIDFDALRLRAPEIVYDLPAGGKRFVQEADGYRHTIKAGVVTFKDGEATGETPGGLLRGGLLRGGRSVAGRA